jgi:hypothetical protein
MDVDCNPVNGPVTLLMVPVNGANHRFKPPFQFILLSLHPQ